MTVIIFSKTTSSPDESLVSNLQREIALLSSARVVDSELDDGFMRLHTKKLWIAVNAVEVMGPVESGDRIIAKNGPRRIVSGMDSRSSASFTSLFKSWKPAISSCSVLPRRRDVFSLVCLVLLRPRLLASADSRVLNECVANAHREFLRITEVTDSISESRMCLIDTLPGGMKAMDPGLEESMSRIRRIEWVEMAVA